MGFCFIWFRTYREKQGQSYRNERETKKKVVCNIIKILITCGGKNFM